MSAHRPPVDRRSSLARFGAWMAGAPALNRSQTGRELRLAPVEEIVAAPELEQMARLVLPPGTFETVRRADRGSFDRMTFRQRLMVYAMDLDLTTDLLGASLFAPIVVGPVARQRDFHPEAELATARGAAAARTAMVVSRQSSEPIERIAAQTDQPLWYQVYPDGDGGQLRADVEAAVSAGCRALCVTVGRTSDGAPTATDWPVIERLAVASRVPLVIKGIMRPADARTALDHGAGGLVVSDHGASGRAPSVQPIEVLPAVADDVGGQVPVLVDGGFIRGSDILKGLALGATAVLLARPMMWGLAAYGADGVETALRLLINELARNMAASGRPTIEMIDRELVRRDSR